jgi:hypothetical protein
VLSFERLAAICMLSTALLITQVHVFSRTAPQQKQKEVQPKLDIELIHSVDGHDLYRAYCASCHGMGAGGDGPVAPALKTQVPDLTLITRRSHGVFPSERVSRIISGEESPVAHGSREMPVWGPVFHQVEADQDWGNVRLQNLTRYLESIQKK